MTLAERPVTNQASYWPDAAGVWEALRNKAAVEARASPFAEELLERTVLRHATLQAGLSCLLAERFQTPHASTSRLEGVILEGLSSDGSGSFHGACSDLLAAVERDNAHPHLLHVFLSYKGYLALQAHRCTHWLWQHERFMEALWLQTRTSEVFGVDIHPCARIGAGIVIDHATGIVVGETAVIEDGVMLFHAVTLGATGKHDGDRHPKIRQGAFIGAGAQILGNIEIGQGARIGAGSVVLDSVPAFATAVGVPARIVDNCDRLPTLITLHTAAQPTSLGMSPGAMRAGSVSQSAPVPPGRQFVRTLPSCCAPRSTSTAAAQHERV